MKVTKKHSSQLSGSIWMLNSIDAISWSLHSRGNWVFYFEGRLASTKTLRAIGTLDKNSAYGVLLFIGPWAYHAFEKGGHIKYVRMNWGISATNLSFFSWRELNDDDSELRVYGSDGWFPLAYMKLHRKEIFHAPWLEITHNVWFVTRREATHMPDLSSCIQEGSL